MKNPMYIRGRPRIDAVGELPSEKEDWTKAAIIRANI